MSTHANMVKMTVSSVSATPSTGKGDITLNAASTGFQSFADAYGANATVDILITKGAEWEVARNCTYTHSGTTLTRGTWEDSSNGTGAIVADNTAVVSVVATAAFGNATENFLGAWGALSGENSITGAATAVIGRLNVCSGTSANYTVTLPAVSGNAGKYIGFQMAPGLTKLVTLDGNSTETIDGATTRVMWAQETALLYCDGSTWTKIAGKSIPMFCSMKRAAVKSISTSTESLIEMDTIIAEAPAGLGNTTSGRITVARPGKYTVSAACAYNMTSASVNNQTYVRVNGTKQEFICLIASGGAWSIGPSVSLVVEVAAAGYIELGGYHSGTGSENTFANTPQLIAMEHIQW